MASSTPLNGATGVARRGNGPGHLQQGDGSRQINATTFTLTSGAAAVPVPGAVTYAGSTAVFSPAAPLQGDGSYTATITTGAKSTPGRRPRREPLLDLHDPWRRRDDADGPLQSRPANGATGVPMNGNASATFSEAMDPATLTATTFTLTSGAAAVPVPGTVIYANSTAVFWPAAPLASNASFTATITTGARSALGVALAANHAWSFTTGPRMQPWASR